MRKRVFMMVAIGVVLVYPLYSVGDDNALTAGYGFGMFNLSPKYGKLRGDNGNYYFYQLAYAREKTLVKDFYLLVEPFVAYVNDPQSGLDAGMMLSLKYYFSKDNKNGFFATLGTGAAYTTIKFEEQGSHLLFILQGGIGYRWNNYFIENRLRHYSNGGIEYPNRSINANIVNIGMHF
ncbi:MAG: acyloxyacyl hydrolase [Candidatus Aenigmarchaeota archaeon]|nr:acyloxyacyl hydrolase [Candidatus Aenigmarchaeota archaeon]